jgi:hypothetical protein
MRYLNKALPILFSCAAIALISYKLYPYLQPENTIMNKPIEKIDSIVNTIKQLDFPTANEDLRQAFIGEIQSIYTHDNPEIDPDIKYVWVLSARHNYKKEAVMSSPQNSNAYDQNDGYDRMNLGIEIARKVAAKKVNKSENSLTLSDIIAHGPIIIYNGEEESNNTLRSVLNKKEITNYPSSKFVILSLPKDQIHTKGQFESLKQESERGRIDLINSTIAIVTHAYHLPRTGRIDNISYFPSTKIIAYLVDRKFEAPGVINELKLEVQKLPSYVEKGFILSHLNLNTSYNGAAR